ncbi:MAG: hypothetical protein ACI4O0_09150 [Candidatus Limivicinus sp.]
MKTKRFVSTLLALLLICSLPVSAFAEEYDLANGSISVTADDSGQYVTQKNGVTNEQQTTPTVITQSNSETPTGNIIEIEAGAGATANVTLSGVNIEATGPIRTEGAGNVVIELDGANNAQSKGNHRAGVEKNNNGNLTITDENETHGSLKATGGEIAAGIGGSTDSSASNITISGNAEVTAKGGENGAGIGGGPNGSGNDITITGNAKVTAIGGDSAAGIGGGSGGSGSNITVSEDAQVKAQGGKVWGNLGAGAAIGNGGVGYTDGAEVSPNTDDLNEGWIATYAPGTTDLDTAVPNSLTYKDASGTVTTATQGIAIEDAQSATCTEDGNKAGFSVDGALVAVTIPATGHSFTNYITNNDGSKTAKCDHCDATDTIPGPGSKLALDVAPLYRVIDQDGKALACKAERQDGALTITVDADFAALTGKLGGIQTLKAQGVDTIVFVTNDAASTFALSDLLSQGSTGDSYTLTHDGSTVTFTLGAAKTDVSGILAKP